MKNLDKIGTYALGAAALAYLYHHLESATRVELSKIVRVNIGYLTKRSDFQQNSNQKSSR
ncbi:hypothetical protein Scep_026062 [Stephania cephalantha]|uniref:Uncharacterized protein n=1 Tax=Stephania cephalantha TaxID=152367 RepID=A0AAP0EQ07_9MAGN